MKYVLRVNKFFLFLLIIFICLNVTKQLLKNTNLNTKQIIEKQNKIKHYQTNKLSSIQNSLSKIYRYSNLDNKNYEKVSFFKILIKFISVYFQFFLIFCVISFHKWYEEMQIIKSNHVENKYSNFKDLTLKENQDKDISEFDGHYIFTSGTTNIKSTAKDEIFNFSFNSKNYAMLERKVEYYDVISEKWHRLGHISHREETTDEILDSYLPEITLISDSLMQIDFDGNIFTFPRVISSIFMGQFECEKISVMAKLKHGCFKTLHIPYQYKEDFASEHTSYINLSSNMVVTPNINFDLCNFLFCFCFSGPATYIHKDEVASDPCTHISSINWLFEKEMTKSEMINEKHQIKKFSHFMTRLIIFNILLVFLFILPEPLIFIIKFFGTTPEYIHKHSLVYSIIIAKLTVPLVYLFTKISFKAKHLTNMFLLTLSIFLLITYVIKEIIIFI